MLLFSLLIPCLLKAKNLTAKGLKETTVLYFKMFGQFAGFLEFLWIINKEQIAITKVKNVDKIKKKIYIYSNISRETCSLNDKLVFAFCHNFSGLNL